MEIKSIIVDDEPLARNIINEFSRNIPSLQILTEFGDAISAHEFLNSNQIDLIFLDINMPRISGIEFLKNFKNPPFVILTTAYSDYALESYELNVVDYLKKPFSFERFYKAFIKVEEQVRLKKSLSLKSDNFKTDNFIFLKSDKKNIKINITDICYIEGLGDYIKIYTDNQKFISNLSMKKINEILSEPDFFRIHKSYIVSINKIESIEGNLLKVNNTRIPIGSNYRQDLIDFVKKHSAD